ncbi:hypothetical protein NCS57_01189800 [Fusarium keratoplasticum]|uniref:Uncharacterized protein n=1 Tax=Fusarium keratoplasticum TaxID=1328300 RepID=A0ACC0QGT4_9HYPO|nr:hypothetical protein NCS57_01189800 [Fusarium keratoplasticum]KAI8654444.1 hypothetical protein NCS57_01189800 [Fusarium keratoplasticum]
MACPPPHCPSSGPSCFLVLSLLAVATNSPPARRLSPGMYTPDHDPRHANDSPLYLDDELELDYGTPQLPTCDTPCARGSPFQDSCLPLLQLNNWDPAFRDDELDPTCIHYDIEWKLQLKKGRLSKLVEITEENLTLAPGAYWDKFLSAELAATVKDKLPEPRYEPDETTVVVSVEKRSERNMRKRFNGLIVDWKTVEDKLRSWAPLFREGNKLRIYISFVYKEIIQPTAVATRSRGRGATGRQLIARDQLLADQEETTGSRPIWKEVYELLHCTGVPCVNSQFYCWRDPESKKHYKLDTSILGMLVDFAEEGNLLRTHDDVPENIRQVIYKHEEESSERRKLKRKRSDSSPPINIHVTCPGYPGQHSGDIFARPNVEARGEAQESVLLSRNRPVDLVIPMRRNKALEKYHEWQQDQVDSPRWQQSIQHAYEITREACLDLKHVHTKVGIEFYTDKGVQLGVALSFINDVPRWVEEALG